MKYNYSAKTQTRGRKIISIAILFVFVFAIWLVCSTGKASGQERREPSVRYISVQIEEGDSLWSLASSYKDASQDIHHYIKQIRTVNHLSATDPLIASEYLIIPLYS